MYPLIPRGWSSRITRWRFLTNCNHLLFSPLLGEMIQFSPLLVGSNLQVAWELWLGRLPQPMTLTGEPCNLEAPKQQRVIFFWNDRYLTRYKTGHKKCWGDLVLCNFGREMILSKIFWIFLKNIYNMLMFVPLSTMRWPIQWTKRIGNQGVSNQEQLVRKPRKGSWGSISLVAPDFWSISDVSVLIIRFLLDDILKRWVTMALHCFGSRWKKAGSEVVKQKALDHLDTENTIKLDLVYVFLSWCSLGMH